MFMVIHEPMTDIHVTSIPVRFQDIDSMGHVNNTEYSEFLAEARAGYYDAVLDYDLQAADTVVVHMSIDYDNEIRHGDIVDIEVLVSKLGSTSITIEYVLRVDEGIVATAKTIQVMYDRIEGSSRPIPTAWRRKIEAHEGL